MSLPCLSGFGTHIVSFLRFPVFPIRFLSLFHPRACICDIERRYISEDSVFWEEQSCGEKSVLLWVLYHHFRQYGSFIPPFWTRPDEYFSVSFSWIESHDLDRDLFGFFPFFLSSDLYLSNWCTVWIETCSSFLYIPCFSPSINRSREIVGIWIIIQRAFVFFRSLFIFPINSSFAGYFRENLTTYPSSSIFRRVLDLLFHFLCWNICCPFLFYLYCCILRWVLLSFHVYILALSFSFSLSEGKLKDSFLVTPFYTLLPLVEDFIRIAFSFFQPHPLFSSFIYFIYFLGLFLFCLFVCLLNLYTSGYNPHEFEDVHPCTLR